MDRRGISRAVIAVAGAVAMLGVVASAAEIVGVERSNLAGFKGSSQHVLAGVRVAVR